MHPCRFVRTDHAYRLPKRTRTGTGCTCSTAGDSLKTQQEASKPNPAPPTAEAPASSSPALVQEPAAPQQDPTAQAIESKPFGEGTLALTKAKVVGQILNVEFIFTPPKKPNGDYKFTNVHSGELKDFAYIDETTSKRISLLQDEKRQIHG